MVGIAVLTIVVSMAKRKITNMTPKAARFLLRVVNVVEVSDKFTSKRIARICFL